MSIEQAIEDGAGMEDPMSITLDDLEAEQDAVNRELGYRGPPNLERILAGQRDSVFINAGQIQDHSILLITAKNLCTALEKDVILSFVTITEGKDFVQTTHTFKYDAEVYHGGMIDSVKSEVLPF